MCCLLLGGWLSWHHPLAPTLTTLAFLLWSTVAFLRPNMWLMIVPALLPIVDLAPWTGWLIVEEFDLLVLGAAAGAYASIALRVTGHGSAVTTPHVAPVVRTRGRAPLLPAEGGRPSAGSMILIMCFGVWTAVGLCRGFSAAGWTELDGDHCRWHCQIDFQPPTGVPDEGRLRWHDGLLIEEGVHEPYVEIWERVAIGAGTARAAPATSADEVLVVCGDAFLYARDRRPPLPIADSLESLLNAATDEDQVTHLLDCEISFGACAFGAIPWQIRLSTVPSREGRGLVDGR